MTITQIEKYEAAHKAFVEKEKKQAKEVIQSIINSMRKNGEYRFPYPRPVDPFDGYPDYRKMTMILGLRLKDGLPQWCIYDGMVHRVVYKDGKAIKRINVARWEECQIGKGGSLMGSCSLWRMMMYYLKDSSTKFVKGYSPDECTKDFRDLDEVAKEYKAEKVEEAIDVHI